LVFLQPPSLQRNYYLRAPQVLVIAVSGNISPLKRAPLLAQARLLTIKTAITAIVLAPHLTA